MSILVERFHILLSNKRIKIWKMREKVVDSRKNLVTEVIFLWASTIEEITNLQSQRGSNMVRILLARTQKKFLQDSQTFFRVKVFNIVKLIQKPDLTFRWDGRSDTLFNIFYLRVYQTIPNIKQSAQINNINPW